MLRWGVYFEKHQQNFGAGLSVGKNSGTRGKVLDHLADFRERSLMFQDRVTMALIYPAIVVSQAVAVSVFRARHAGSGGSRSIKWRGRATKPACLPAALPRSTGLRGGTTKPARAFV